MHKRKPVDFLIPFFVAAFFVIVTNFLGGKWVDAMEKKADEDVYSDFEIGAAATKNVPVVSSIEEMMQEDHFTFHITETLNYFDSSTYYEGDVYDLVKLDSGELVVVVDYYPHINYDSDEGDEDEEWFITHDVYAVYPIGRVIHKPLPQKIIDDFTKNGYTLSDTSFYVDMKGDYKIFRREEYEAKIINLCFLVAVIAFLLTRYLLIASGLFSPLFPLRFLKRWKRFIVYYNVVYYDENIKAICDYRKQGNMEEAAREFSILTNANMEEAREALKLWKDIYCEGILTMKE